MMEATWGHDAKTPPINWRMSAALENVPRGEEDVAEVTSLEGAVRAWSGLDPQHRAEAVLTTEHPVQVNGISSQSFAGQGIGALVDLLPSASA